MCSPSETLRQLHVLTRTDRLAAEVIEFQRQAPRTRVEVLDLSGPEPDYAGLLEAVLEADHVTVW